MSPTAIYQDRHLLPLDEPSEVECLGSWCTTQDMVKRLFESLGISFNHLLNRLQILLIGCISVLTQTIFVS